MAYFTLLLILAPYISVVNRIPQYVGLYRVIWRDHYARATKEAPTATREPTLVG